MPNEVELKLWFPPNARDQIAERLQRCGLEQKASVQVSNQYLDTPDLALNQATCALRIRRLGQQWLQTFKTQGSSEQGLHQRQEWEWSLDQPTLNLELLTKVANESVLPGIHWEDVVPLFQTDFERTLWVDPKSPEAIEIVVDTGKVFLPQEGHEECISEIELELKAGSETDIWLAAEALTQELPLLPSSISKAERGYRLMDINQWEALAEERIQAPCQSIADVIWGLEYLRFHYFVIGNNQPTTQSGKKGNEPVYQWVRAYPNDRIQSLLDQCLSNQFKKHDAVQALGQKLLAKVRNAATMAPIKGLG